MEFDPNDHETKDIISRARRFKLPGLNLPSGLPKLPLNKSILTSIGVFSALFIWLISGVVSDSADPIEPAKALVETTSAAPGKFKVTVKTLEAEAVTSTVRLQARTEADKVVTVAAETGGTISKLPVDKGAFVQGGQTLCQIDIGARQAQLDQARAMRDARRIEYKAAQRLNRKGHASRSQLAAARASFDAAIAGVKTALVELERTQIKAPFDGILDRQPVKLGQYMSPGQPCGTIIDKDPLLVVAHIAENQVTGVSVGAKGIARLATGETVGGFIRYIAETPNAATRTFRLELEVPNKDLSLRDGISAEMDLEGGEVMATLIPQSVLTLGDEGVLGVRVVDDGKVAFRPVSVLSDDSNGALVVGLAAREQVITRGGEFTRDGRAVEFEIEPSDTSDRASGQ